MPMTNDNGQRTKPILEMVSITKEFPGVKALDGVTFESLRRRISRARRRKRRGKIYFDESFERRLSVRRIRRRH